jgi:hypothetical protein
MSPEAHRFAKATLVSYRHAKVRREPPSPLHRTPQKYSSPLPANLAALLSHRVQRHRRIRGDLGDRFEHSINRTSGRNSRLPKSPQTSWHHGDFFQDAYLSALLEPCEKEASGASTDARELWGNILRAHTQGSQLSAVIANRAEKVRKALRDKELGNHLDAREAPVIATLMSDLRIAAEQRQLLDSRLSAALRELGGPVDAVQRSIPHILPSTARGWLTAVDLEKVRRDAAKAHASAVKELENDKVKLEQKLALFQKQIQMMESDRRHHRLATTDFSDQWLPPSSAEFEEHLELKAKLRRCERQVEEGRELIQCLRETIAAAIGERDAAVDDLNKAAAARSLRTIDAPLLPVTPAHSLANADAQDSNMSEPRETPTPGRPQGAAELSELEKALAMASDVLDGADSDASQPKRLSFSPAYDSALSPVRMLNPEPSTRSDDALSGEFQQVVAQVQRLAGRERLNNRSAETLDAGMVTNATPVDAETAWLSLEASASSTHASTRESDGDIDPTKIHVAGTEYLIGRRAPRKFDAVDEDGGKVILELDRGLPPSSTRTSTSTPYELNTRSPYAGTSPFNGPSERSKSVATLSNYSPPRKSTLGRVLQSMAELSGLATPARRDHHQSAVMIF